MLDEQIFKLKIAPCNRKHKAFTKFEAYIFLLVRSSQSQDFKSYYLAKTWGWSRTKVKSFLDYLHENSLLISEEKDIKKTSEKT